MNNLYLMSQSQLAKYIQARERIDKITEGMSKDELESNANFVIKGSIINDLDEIGNADFDIDSDGIAHIPIVGMLKNTIGIIDIIGAVLFGKAATTYQYITEATIQAESDGDVKGIIYDLNTGGGEVQGIEATSNAIFNAKKPTKSIVRSSAESGGYWLGAQSDEFIAAGKTSFLGSIGIAAEFIDKTAAETAQGIQRVIITSTDAPKKRFDIKSEDGQQIIIEMMDEMHAIFVEHIVRGRGKQIQGITTDFVNKKFGQGSTMGAKKALRHKMIDGILSATNGNGKSLFSAETTTPVKTPVKPIILEENMTLKEYLAQNPEAKAQYDKDIAAVEPVDMSNFELKYILGKAPKAKEQHEKALSDARTEVETGKLSKETITSVVNTISSDAYGKSIKNAGAKVLHGEKDYSSFEDLVTQADEFNAKLKLAGIKIDQPPATPGEQILDKKTLAQAKTKAAAKELSDEIKNTIVNVK